MDALIRALRWDFNGEILVDEPMSKHTTYKIGGPASYFVTVDDLGSLTTLCKALEGLGWVWFVIGSGSNLLVSDEGFAGVVIKLGEAFDGCKYDPETGIISAGCACRLSRVVSEAATQNRSGMEFAVGTPGTVGGALRMNAGTSRDYLGSRVVSVTTLRPGMGLVKYDAAEISWSYRSSSIPADEIIVECEIATRQPEDDDVRGRMIRALERRKKTQPLGLPSCGSVFQNPEKDSAGRLIENVGLKGASCGGAAFSSLHANFIVNTGQATADEVLTLIHAAQDSVMDKYQIHLTPEVRFLGFS